MNYIVYKITNRVNGKFYIGTHKTVDPNDNYMGSGTLLKRAIQKHGIENFTKEILFKFDNPEDMFAKEAEIVTEDFLAEENTYNLKIGGFGGFDFINNNISLRKDKNIRARKKTAAILEKKYGKDFQKALSNIAASNPRKSNRDTMVVRYGLGAYKSFQGKTHSKETKKLIGKNSSICQSGSKNSQYGTRWIHSLSEKMSRRIGKLDALPNGWIEGRKIKF
jgi:hypothetical protein